jgi:hypothetical protein
MLFSMRYQVSVRRLAVGVFPHDFVAVEAPSVD